jgi:APA family basic amino acid/polyamine antiporter
MAQLKRTLGLGQCIFFGVGSILGAGIYTLVGKVAGWGGNLTWLSFLVASVTALFTAFSYAELCAAFPTSGGEYEYAKKAFGKTTGVVLGSVISANGIISGATVSLGFAGYFAQLLPVSTMIASLGIIGLIFLINVLGMKQSSVVNIVFTLIEAGGLFFVIYTAFPTIGNVDLFDMPEKGAIGFFAAASLSFYAYIGFEDIVKLAEETKQPEKNIPRALFISSIIIVIIYTLVTICAVSAVPWQQLSKSGSPLADIVKSRFGSTGVIVISIIALFSTSNTILSNMIGSSRVLLNIGKESKAMSRFAYISPKRNTPVAALVLILIVMCSFALIGRIEVVALIANLFIFITFILVNLSVIILRRKEKDIKRPFRIPLNISGIPVISVLGIIMTLILLAFNIYGLINSGS